MVSVPLYKLYCSFKASLIGDTEVAGTCSQAEGKHDTCFLIEKMLVSNFTLINVTQMELTLKTD